MNRSARAVVSPSMTRVLLAVSILLLMVAAGTAAVAQTATTSKTARIKVGDDFFSPAERTVKKGTRLKFVWTGKNTHNVKATGAARKESDFQRKGTYSFRARKRGTIKLTCEIHLGMTGSVKVVKKRR